MKEAKFYVWDRDHFRFVHLTADEPEIEWDYGGPTDEGYSWEYEAFTLDPETGVVTSEQESSSRDCDGKMYTKQVLTCQPDRLAVHVPHGFTETNAPFRLPDWQKENSTQRDFAAEKAGY